MSRLAPHRGKARAIAAVERVVITVLIVVCLIYLLGPVTWMAVSSLSPDRDLLSRPTHWIPTHATTIHYRTLLQLPGADPGTLDRNPQVRAYVRSFFNSSIIAFGTTLLCLGLGSVSAYCLTRFVRPATRRPILFMLLATRMIPVIAVLIPVYIGLQKLGLLNTLHGLILVYTGLLLPFVIWILEAFYRGIPIELEEAAAMDGASPSRVLFQIVLPLSWNALFAAGVFVFIAAWSDFIVALVLTNSERAWPIPVVLAQLLNPITQPSWGLLNSAALTAALVPAVLALLTRHTITRGILAGALKG